MKISNKQYAQGLYQAIKGKDEAKQKEEVGNFIKILVSNNDLNKAKAIISEFEKAWQAGENTVEAEVATSEALEAEVLAELKAFVATETGAAKVDMKHSVDKNLLAGFVLRYGDKLVDGSAKELISNLKKDLIK